MYESVSEVTKETITAPNGHHLHKSAGGTRFHGALENLPRPERFDLAEAIEGMHRDGYAIFPAVLDAEEVAEMRALMDALGGPDEEYVVKNWCFNKHIVSDIPHNPSFLKYIDRPEIVAVAEAVMGPDCKCAGGSSWITGKGREMGLHSDYQFLALPADVAMRPDVRVPIYTATAHYYLNDMTAELGPTILVPGSHRAGRPPVNESGWNGIDPKAVMVKAGDVCMFRSELWHGAWMHTGEARRYIMQVHYGAGCMASGYPSIQYESLYSKAVLEQANPMQRKLLGAKPKPAPKPVEAPKPAETKPEAAKSAAMEPAGAA